MLPVVAFDSANGVKNLLKNNGGILIQDRDKEEMSKEIIKLLKDEKYSDKVRKNGHEMCKQYLSKNVKNMWFELLK